MLLNLLHIYLVVSILGGGVVVYEIATDKRGFSSLLDRFELQLPMLNHAVAIFIVSLVIFLVAGFAGLVWPWWLPFWILHKSTEYWKG